MTYPMPALPTTPVGVYGYQPQPLYPTQPVYTPVQPTYGYQPQLQISPQARQQLQALRQANQAALQQARLVVQTDLQNYQRAGATPQQLQMRFQQDMQQLRAMSQQARANMNTLRARLGLPPLPAPGQRMPRGARPMGFAGQLRQQLGLMPGGWGR